MLNRVRQWFNADRTGIRPMEGRLWLKMLIVLIAAAYFYWVFGGLIPFGFLLDDGPVTVYNAIGPWNQNDYIEGIFSTIGQIAGALILAYALLHCLAPKAEKKMIGLSAHCFAFTAALFMFVLSGYAFQALYRTLTYFHIDPRTTSGDGQIFTVGGEAQIIGMVDSMLGPISEEIIALFLMVVILRRCNIAWLWIVAIEGALRVSYHLYEGIPAFSHLLWICAVVVIYKCSGSLIGIVAAHILYDISIEYWPYDFQTVQLTVLAIGALLCGLLYAEHAHRSRNQTVDAVGH